MVVKTTNKIYSLTLIDKEKDNYHMYVRCLEICEIQHEHF
jgi:hypothetical protein